jgi:hypothetical protein
MTTSLRWLPSLFAIALGVWVGASAILGIPHGSGHSIESLTVFETLRDVSLPFVVGGFLAILASLALAATGRLTRERP